AQVAMMTTNARRFHIVQSFRENSRSVFQSVGRSILCRVSPSQQSRFYRRPPGMSTRWDSSNDLQDVLWLSDNRRLRQDQPASEAQAHSENPAVEPRAIG